MGTVWTEEQQKVITLRNRNILVSAAAGSGKTAVLVERIITMITDETHPIDIDQLVIVTFTNAAASEMRERISDAIEKKLGENPENEHLQRQLTIIHNAQITTIHSFCLYVIRNNFNVIDLDPGFCMADEGELKLIKSDVMKQLLEDCYEEKEERFLNFIECYSTGKSDDGIEELVMQLYDFSMSYPWPEKWLIRCKGSYELREEEEMEQTGWMKILLQNFRLNLSDLILRVQDALKLCLSGEGPYYYEGALSEDQKLLEKLNHANTYGELSVLFSDIKFARLSSKKDTAVSEAKKEMVKQIRDEIKKNVGALKEQYFFQSEEQMRCDMAGSSPAVSVLIDLTIAFSERFSKKKREKNLVDFNDLEHFALNILAEDRDGTPVPTSVAREFSEAYEEILIDEYQDSNFVQEILLNSISKSWSGRQNVFMVGDVKQSIYRFRLARPELFLAKYQTYSLEDSQYQRIDLHKNFRSRSQVLDGINFIFDQIMARCLGNIEYGKDTALYAGAVFPDQGNGVNLKSGGGHRADPPENNASASEVRRTDYDTELLLVDLDHEALTEENSALTSKELEAKAVAVKIKAMIGKQPVYDRKTGGSRPARYRDMVILLRTVSGWADTFVRVLKAEGVPAYSGSSTGYFSAVEIRTILSLLDLIDNPMQEIPLAAVLMSPVVNLTGEELAQIKSSFPEHRLWEGAFRYRQEGELAELREKLAEFYSILEDFRELVPHTPIHELLWKILDRTGYGDFAAAMPGGEQRKANLDMLIEKAIAFEATSYRGLFNFVRYIEHLQKYDVDFGEASVFGENEDTVRIMSIHKSKGLEFPVVFVSGLGKNFNMQDSRSKIVLHPDLGIGTDFIDPVLRVRSATLLKKIIQRQTVLENLGEELRVLYVALTRAKEKLIMTGAVTKLEDKLKKWMPAANRSTVKLSFHQLSSASGCLEWILSSLIRHGSFAGILEEYGYEVPFMNPLYDSAVTYRISVVTLAELTGDEIAEQVKKQVSKEDFLEWNTEWTYSSEAREQFEKRLGFVYPYAAESDIRMKLTVSELKKLGQFVDEEWSEKLYESAPEREKDLEGGTKGSPDNKEEQEIVPLIPRFMEGKQEVPAAKKGTAYHKVLECLDYRNLTDKATLRSQLKTMREEAKIDNETAELVAPSYLYRYLESELVKRMSKAAQAGLLYREQQFVIGVTAREVSGKYKSDELILIQGIIDAYFYEGDDIILVDFKTDFIREGGEQRLIERYGVQLDYYAQALERMTEKKVAEKIIYSFTLNKEIKLTENSKTDALS